MHQQLGIDKPEVMDMLESKKNSQNVIINNLKKSNEVVGTDCATLRNNLAETERENKCLSDLLSALREEFLVLRQKCNAIQAENVKMLAEVTIKNMRTCDASV